MNSKYFISFLGVYIIPVFSIFISYYLGRISTKTDTKIESLKYRYETAYVPYMEKLLKGFTWDVIIGKDSARDVFPYIETIFDNFHLFGKKTVDLMPDLYQSMLDLLEFHDGNPDYPNAVKDFNYVFNKITVSILKEAQEIAPKIQFPETAKSLLLLFDEHKSV